MSDSQFDFGKVQQTLDALPGRPAHTTVDLLVRFEEIDRAMSPLLPGHQRCPAAKPALERAAELRRAFAERAAGAVISSVQINELLSTMNDKAIAAHQHMLRRERLLSLHAVVEAVLAKASTPSRFAEVLCRWLPHLPTVRLQSIRCHADGWNLADVYEVRDRLIDRRRHLSALFLQTDAPGCNNLIILSRLPRGTGRSDAVGAVARQLPRFLEWLGDRPTLLVGAGYGGAAAQALATIAPAHVRDQLGVVTYLTDPIGPYLAETWAGRDPQVQHFIASDPGRFIPSQNLGGQIQELAGAGQTPTTSADPVCKHSRQKLARDAQMHSPAPSVQQTIERFADYAGDADALRELADSVGRNTLYVEILPMMAPAARLVALQNLAQAGVVVPTKYRFSAQILESIAHQPTAASRRLRAACMKPYRDFMEKKDPILAAQVDRASQNADSMTAMNLATSRIATPPSVSCPPSLGFSA